MAVLLRYPCYECILGREGVVYPGMQTADSACNVKCVEHKDLPYRRGQSGNELMSNGGQYCIFVGPLNLIAIYNSREYPTVSDDINDTADPQAEENGFPQKFHSVRLAEPQRLCPNPAHEILGKREP
jgi:hypothetical protein